MTLLKQNYFYYELISKFLLIIFRLYSMSALFTQARRFHGQLFLKFFLSHNLGQNRQTLELYIRLNPIYQFIFMSID